MTQIHWLTPISDSFTNASDWSGGVVPGAQDDAILDAVGATPYTVTASVSETVSSIQTASTATLSITGGPFTAMAGSGNGANNGVILVGAGASLVADGVLKNTGTIFLGDGDGSAALLTDGTTTLSGGGQIILNDYGRQVIKNSPMTRNGYFINLDNTISGAGAIGGQHCGVENGAKGVIDASGSAQLMFRSRDRYLNNDGLLEATGNGGLTLDLSVDNGPTGVILAGDGSIVRVEGLVFGGTLESAGTGLIATSGSAAFFQLTNHAQVFVADGTQLLINGNIENTGEITLGHGTGSTRLLIFGSDRVTLSGGGTVSFGPSPSNAFFTNGGGLTNLDNTIAGAGLISGATVGIPFSLVNEPRGIIDADSSAGLTIDTNGALVMNAGLIEATGSGVGLVVSPVRNEGTIAVIGGSLTFSGAVTDSGVATIDGGTLDFIFSFNESVTFTGTSGVLELAQSKSYRKTITGFSKTGGTSLDLGDVAFVGSAEATFSGTKNGGVLTVSDGAHAAHINLAGDYLSSTFVASSDSHGGTIVRTARSLAAPAHRFIAASAGLGGSAGEAIHTGAALAGHAPVLARPHVMIA